MQNHGDQSAAGSVELSVDGKAGQSAPLAIEKNGRWQQLFELNASGGREIDRPHHAKRRLRFDDTAELEPPAAPPPHRVKLQADERSGLKEILAARRRVELTGEDDEGDPNHRGQDAGPASGAPLPPGPLLIFTPGACDLWQLGDSVPDPLVTHVEETSPVTGGVRLWNTYLPEAKQLQLADSIRDAAKPILWAGKTPLGYAIDRPAGRIVVICGNLATSTLPLEADFAMLLGQALDWLDGQQPWRDEVVEGNLECGNSLPLSAALRPLKAATGRKAVMNYRTPNIDLRVPGDIGRDAAAEHYETPRLPLWIPLAAAAAVLAIVEWCLYQRRWTS